MRIFVALLLMAACNKEEPQDTADTGPVVPAEETAACDLRGEAGREMTAGDTPDSTAPQLPLTSEPATITIIEDRANYVRLEVDQPGTLVVFASDVDVLMHVQEGVVSIESPDPVAVDSCPDDIPERHDIPIDQAGTYHLRIAWMGFRSIWVYADLLPAE